MIIKNMTARLVLASMMGTLFQFLLLVTPTYAAGLANPTAVSTVKTISATTNKVTLALTTTTAIPAGGKIELTFPSFTVAGVWTITTDFDVDARATDTAAGSGQVVTITIGTTTLAAGAHTIQLNKALNSKLVNPATMGFYQVTMKTRTTAGGATADWGAAVIDIGNDGDVLVTAEVDSTLSLNIGTTANDAVDTNACAFTPQLSTAAIRTCDYRIRVGTNAVSGYTVKILADDQLNIDTTPTQDVNDVTDNAVTIGSEEYGVQVMSVSSAEAGTTVTRGTNFGVGLDKLIPLTADTIISSNGPDAGTAGAGKSSLIRHSAAISAATGAGSYTQIVTYSATASF